MKNFIHPFLLGTAHVLMLISNNVLEVPSLGMTLSSILMTGIFTAALVFAVAALVKDKPKAGLVATGLVVFFFSYGYIHRIVKYSPLRPISDHMIFFPVWAVAIAGAIFLILKTKRNLDGFVGFLNFMSVVLVCFPILTLTAVASLGNLSVGEASQAIALQPAENAPKPDIYHILLDGYSHHNSLMKYYDFDNRPFLMELESLGFNVVEDGTANYTYTDHAISSMLNTAHTSDMFDVIEAKKHPHTIEQLIMWARLRYLLGHSRVASALQDIGYTFVLSGAPSAWYMSAADVHSGCRSWFKVFMRTFIRSTALATIQNKPALKQFADQLTTRGEIDCILDYTADIRNELEGPLFVYTHIISPHPPYLFDEDGDRPTIGNTCNEGLCADVDTKRSKELYIEQLQYVNELVLDLIRTIKENSDTEPIILLNSDHGGAYFRKPNPDNDAFIDERTKILNTYHFPGDGNTSVYETVTPVNSYRLVFNEYFGTNFEMLPDNRHYVTITQKASDVNEITEPVTWVPDEVLFPYPATPYEDDVTGTSAVTQATP